MATAYFNPRAPCGARPPDWRDYARDTDFNPRAPCGARLCWDNAIAVGAPISILAPRAGRDQCYCFTRPYSRLFQSSRPVRGATGEFLQEQNAAAISILAPRAGRDLSTGQQSIGDAISILAPRAGRDQADDPRQDLTGISILAPRAGRDTLCTAERVLPLPFQSSRPVRGATSAVSEFLTKPFISILAPRAGRDISSRGRGRTRSRFQSSRPVRGATAKMHKLSCIFSITANRR